MKDVNSVRLSGSIFWSKLDDRQTYSVLRIGIKLANGSSVFASINNPNTKVYDLVKAGNKVLISNGWLDTWEKKEGGFELQIKANGTGCEFFPKEKALADINHVVVIGKILEYSGDTANIEMIGDRNPKTDQPTIRNARIKIGDTFSADLANSKIMLDAKVISVDEGGKSKLVVEADYDTVSVI